MQTYRLLAVLLVGLLAGGPGAEGAVRRRRWLVFPKGSSLQLVYCWLLSTYGTRDGIFVVNITVGLAWEIPQNLRGLLERESRERLESRHRRQIYAKLSTLIDRQGLDGESCVRRGLCEATAVIQRQAGQSRQASSLTFLQALLGGLFTLPELAEEKGRLDEELEEHRAYEAAAEMTDAEDCETRYPCPLHLFHFK